MYIKQRRILIVDDNPAIHEDLKLIITQQPKTEIQHEARSLETELFDKPEGIFHTQPLPKDNPQKILGQLRIENAYQGQDAIDMVNEAEQQGDQYSIIFMDVRMPPGMDGIQTIAKIWEKYPEIEIIICTAYSDYTWDEIIQTLGNTEHLLFLKKPFESASVKQMTYMLIQRWEEVRHNTSQLKVLRTKVAKRSQQLIELLNHLKQLKDEAVESSLFKNKVLYNVSRELQSPLNGIMGMTNLLMDTQLTDEQKDYASTIKASSNFIRIFIDQLLDYNLTNFEDIRLDDIRFNLRTMVSGIVDFMSIIACEKGVEIASIIHNNVPETLMGDPSKIRQIIITFLHRFINSPKTVKIYIVVQDSTPLHTALCRNSEINFSIEIDAKKQSSSRIDDSQPFENKLNFCRHVISMMGGELSATNGADAQFAYMFSVKLRVDNSSLLQNVQVFPSIKNIHCLILSDNAISSKVVSLFIGKWGGKTSEASSITSASLKIQNALETRPVDIVIADFENEMLENLEKTSHALRHAVPNRKISLICIASHPKKGDFDRIKELGYGAYITKPFKQTHLHNALLIIKSMHDKNESAEGEDFITKHIIEEFFPDTFRILFISRSRQNQKRVAILLQKLNIKCDVIEQCREIPDRLRHCYDLALVDFDSPPNNWKYFLQEYIKPSAHQKKLHILAYSSREPGFDVKLLQAQGIDGVINAPFEIKAIRETLIKFLSTGKCNF